MAIKGDSAVMVAGGESALSGALSGAHAGAGALFSAYEAMMLEKGKTPDAVGKPKGSGVGGAGTAFSMKDKDRRLGEIAKRRAITLMMDVHRDELRSTFEEEYRVLVDRQGYEDVAVVERSVVTSIERVYRG